MAILLGDIEWPIIPMDFFEIYRPDGRTGRSAANETILDDAGEPPRYSPPTSIGVVMPKTCRK